MSNPYKIDWNEYAALARQAVAEGCVLLKNDDKALPIRKGERVSVFGRIQFDYYKSGTGSGGAVNTRYVTNILDALKENKDISVNEELEQTYRDWLKDHPFEKGMGWAQEPWCQEEMSVTKELAEQAAAKSDIAVVIIGRTAGEDKDNSAAEGSYLLTAAEHQMLKEVCGAFKRVAVLLNVGNIMDMKWVKEYDPAAVLYVWQGGQEGGAGAADVLTGIVTPCGKLSDTIALDISDYPSTEGFGDPTRVIYKEDIYVGYRYFETFAKDCVLYPFGYGLSYTTFTRTVESFDFDGETVTEKVTEKTPATCRAKRSSPSSLKHRRASSARPQEASPHSQRPKPCSRAKAKRLRSRSQSQILRPTTTAALRDTDSAMCLKAARITSTRAAVCAAQSSPAALK